MEAALTPVKLMLLVVYPLNDRVNEPLPTPPPKVSCWIAPPAVDWITLVSLLTLTAGTPYQRWQKQGICARARAVVVTKFGQRQSVECVYEENRNAGARCWHHHGAAGQHLPAS